MALNKQQRERILLGVLVVIGVCVWYFYFGKGPAISNGFTGPGSYTPIEAEDYSVIFKDLGASQSTVYKPTGRNIFVAGAVPTPTTTAAVVAKAQPTQLYPTVPQPAPPPLPVLSMKFFGYGSVPSNGPRRAFLLEGEEVHIVQEGDTVQNHIRITHIGNDKIEYEDTVTGQKNSTTLEMPPQA
jgi:hypothetical protein